jgi:hypothetical protein
LLEGEEEEGLVLPVINFGDGRGPTNTEAGTIRECERASLASRVAEKVVRSPTTWLDPVVSGSVIVICTTLCRNAGDPAFGVAELRIEGRGLYSKLLS